MERLMKSEPIGELDSSTGTQGKSLPRGVMGFRSLWGPASPNAHCCQTENRRGQRLVSVVGVNLSGKRSQFFHIYKRK